MIVKNYLLLVASAVLVACGGGGGGDTAPIVNADCVVTNVVSPGTKKDLGGVDGDGSFSGEAGSGDGGASDGGSEGDGNGSLGQFRNTTVVVLNSSQKEIGRTKTDDEGEVHIDIGDCKGAIEIAYIGGDDAQYYDEARDLFVDYPAGKQIRVRLSALRHNFSATPYTEAAVRLMDSAASGLLAQVSKSSHSNDSSLDRLITMSIKGTRKSFDAGIIDTANQRISDVLTDQVPGIFRPLNADGSFGQVDITRVATALNDSTSKEVGNLTNTGLGRRGAVIAGLVAAGGSFLSNAAQPAVVISRQLGDDLADGNLDLQGLSGPVLGTGEAPAYTYESLWRGQVIGAGLALSQAGDLAMQNKAKDAPVANITSALGGFYYAADAPSGGFSTGTKASQRVKLSADGRLTMSRVMTAGFSPSIWITDTNYSNPIEHAISASTIVDVKVGSRGEVLALRKDRRAIEYVKPLDLYTVSGRELAGIANGSNNNTQRINIGRPLLDQAVATPRPIIFDVDQSFVGDQRVVSFTSSPSYRTFSPTRSGIKPDLLFVLQDGSLFAGSANDPTRPFQLSSPPEGLLSVAYDKFVAPGSLPAYGQSSDTNINLPYAGPRRLFGLTRHGQVKVWLESAPLNTAGHLLSIPGHVVLLAGESLTNVYALTSAGDVYWINADQALNVAAGSELSNGTRIDSYARRYALNSVVKIDLGAQKACWIARSEAILCGSGNVMRWRENVATLRYQNAGSSFASRSVMPVSIDAPTVISSANAKPVWRFSGVDGFYSVIDGRSSYSTGLSYLNVDGSVTDRQTLAGKRNLDDPIRLKPDLPVQYGRAITTTQFRTALGSIFKPNSPLQKTIASSFSSQNQAHSLRLSVDQISQDYYQLNAFVDGGGRSQWPPVALKIRVSRNTAGIDGIRVTHIVAGDPDTNTGYSDNDGSVGQISNTEQFRGPYLLKQDSTFNLDSGLINWQAFYANPIVDRSHDADNYNRLVVNILPQIGSDNYEMRICFSYGFQVRSAGNFRSGGLICSLHENDGSYKGASVLMTRQDVNAAKAPTGDVHAIDFEHYYGAPY